ncbi:arsenate reductase/protein-tyrosine-phosphatase family protein [Subtercola lobariae]|uniref:Low molecular weight phosphatase family protein n=1 Tax=Subtercola lobariae TaxID=1588641 RepID=A0A917AZR8_9MICO|nr:low molecular weight phosphatase family protein [Subtercola lobariae]GGF12761.1 low molecular weight phosphatase family protein [Subtercola lobariae]
MPDFSILTVCSGNIIRSPLTELILRSELDRSDVFSISSAGTFAGDGDLMTPEAAEIALALGLDPSAHRARYLVEPYIESADLILALSRAHRREIVQLVPRKVNVTFTLREFARLAALISDDEVTRTIEPLSTTRERLVAIVKLVTTRRGAAGQIEIPADDDVVDPYRRGAEMYSESLSQLSPAASDSAKLLRQATKNPSIGARILH